ncbi:MAG: hypothetical protein R2838_05655 [Caldilineaceae bacterium]
MPTPEPAPTRPLLTEEQFQDGLKRLADNLSTYGLKLDDYRKIVETPPLGQAGRRSWPTSG